MSLASEAASYITGHVLFVDVGMRSIFERTDSRHLKLLFHYYACVSMMLFDSLWETAMAWLKRVSIVGFILSGMGSAFAIDMQFMETSESVFDTSDTEIALVSAEQGDLGAFSLQVARTDTGHFQHSRSNDGKIVFEVQDRVGFEKWLSESWLATSGDGRLDERDVQRKRFNLGPGMYASVPHLSGVCVAYLINTGRKVRAALTRDATEEMFGGTHCSAEAGDAVVTALLDEVDAVRLRR